MANASQNPLTNVVRNWTFMVIFCFASCAAGSCLSYGHSCWGAHGKRSSGHDNSNAYLVPTKTIGSNVQQDIPSFAKEEWILSRLISGRPLIPLPNKYRPRGNNFPKPKAFVPEHWDNGEHNAHINNDELVEDQNNNDNDDEGNRRSFKDVRDIIRSIKEIRKETPEIFLITPNEDNDYGSKQQGVDLFKFLSHANDNFE